MIQFVNTCTITPRTEAKDANTGGLKHPDGTPVTSVRCNVQQISGSESVEFGRETGERFFRVYFLTTAVLAISSKLSAFSGSGVASLSGVALEITSPPVDPVGRGTYLMVTAKEVTT